MTTIELRFHVVTLLAGTYLLVWRALGGPSEPAPVAAAPVAAAPVVATPPPIFVPPGFRVITTDGRDLTSPVTPERPAPVVAPALAPPRPVRPAPRRRRVRTRSS